MAAVCERVGATLLIDAYHHLNLIPFDVAALGLTSAFVVGGGYKYCQLGEGNAFMRIPPGCQLRPVLTGWFSEFAQLARTARPGEVPYGEGAARFAGATYDPASHYRAAAVFAFHQRMGLTADRLRAASRHQVGMLERRVQAADLNPSLVEVIPLPAERRGGFLALRCPQAATVVSNLRARNVFADSRGDVLRLGPAPYLSDQQLREAGDIVADVLKRLK